jgi:hypothetical protein
MTSILRDLWLCRTPAFRIGIGSPAWGLGHCIHEMNSLDRRARTVFMMAALAFQANI